MAKRLLDTIPTVVKVELCYAQGQLGQLAEALRQGRSLDQMFKTGGRYEGEICKKYGGEAQIAKLKEECSSIISKWRKYVIEQGVQIDFDKLLEELNLPEQSSLNVSPEGLAYAKDLDESNNFSTVDN